MQITIDHGPREGFFSRLSTRSSGIRHGTAQNGRVCRTVRELSAALVINPNTIAKAYRQLEQDGIIVTRPGRALWRSCQAI